MACISAHNAGNANIVYCGCNANAGCWSNCCSTFYGLPYVCAAGNCSTNLMIACPHY